MSGAPSGTGSKRPSPPVNNNAPASKRAKNDESGVGTSNQSGSASTAAPAGGSSGGQPIDPDQLSDALTAAGIDLKSEEAQLYSSLQKESIASATLAPKPKEENFLDVRPLASKAAKTAQENGIKVQHNIENPDNELTKLISLSCREWMTDIITEMVALNRHRRRSRNDVHSDLGRALRAIAIKDKEAEDRRIAQKTMMGLETSAEDKRIGSEESQYRNANATALMMTGKKKYSWLTGGAGGGAGGGGSRMSSKNEVNIRYREAREEPQLALRDLIGTLERKRMGVEKTIAKSYARLKN